ncbi:hypothetical protein ACEWY4_010717 [Coilia grayii]|uniref:Myosin tail domain-containing protein n=1 Tax=Coilia grayii TaxID=363190 RepID=A0ABD1K2R3_9TELE
MEGTAEAFGRQLHLQDADGRSFVVLNRHNRSVLQPYGGPEVTFVEHYSVLSARGGRYGPETLPRPPRRHGSHTDLRGAPQYPPRGAPQRAPSPLLNYQRHPELLRPYHPHNNSLQLEQQHRPPPHTQTHSDAHAQHYLRTPPHHLPPPLSSSVSEPLALTPPSSPRQPYSLVVHKARIPLPLATLAPRHPTEVEGHAPSHRGIQAPILSPHGPPGPTNQSEAQPRTGALIGQCDEREVGQRTGRVGHRGRMSVEERRRSRSADNPASSDHTSTAISRGVRDEVGGGGSAATSPRAPATRGEGPVNMGEGPAHKGEGPNAPRGLLKVEKTVAGGQAATDRHNQVTPDLLRGQRKVSSKAGGVTEEMARHALFTYLKHGTTDSDDVIQRKVKLMFEKIQLLRSCSAETLKEGLQTNGGSAEEHTQEVQQQEEEKRRMQAEEEEKRRMQAEEEKRRMQAEEEKRRMQAEEEEKRRRVEEEMSRCEEAQQQLRQQLTHKEKDLQTALQQLQQVQLEREKFCSEIRDLQEQLSDMHDELDRVTHQESGDRQGIMQELLKLRQEFEEVLCSQEAQEEVLRRKERELTALRGALEEEVAAHAEEVTTLKETHEQEVQQLKQRLTREEQACAAGQQEVQHQQEEMLLGRVRELEERVSHLTHLLQEAQRREEQLQEQTHTLMEEKEKLEARLEEVKQQEEDMCGANQALTRHLEDTQCELSVLQQEQKELRRRLQEQGGHAEQLRRERSNMEEQRRRQNTLMEQLQEEMLRVVQEAERSTQLLQEQVEEARGSSEGELSHLLTQLQERQQEILTSTQHNQRLHKELSQLEAELHQCEAELEGAGLKSRKLEQQLEELQEQKRSSQEERGRITRLLEARVAQLEADLREERTNEEQLLQRLERGREQTEQARAELLQEKAARQDLECDKISLERQNRDLRSRVSHLEGGQRSGQDGLVSRLETRIQELETRLEGEERESASLQQANRKLERKLKELMVQVGEEQLSLKDQRDQLALRLKTLKRQLDEAEGEIERLEGSKRKIQRELDEQLEANQQLHTHITELRTDMRRKRRTAPLIKSLEDEEEEEKEEKEEQEEEGASD